VPKKKKTSRQWRRGVFVPVGYRQTVTLRGREVTVRSSLEAEILEALADQGADFEYENDILMWFSTHKYTPDFTLQTRSGKTIYIEAKGWMRPQDRTKMIRVKENNPDADIRFVFERSTTKLRRSSKTTYAMWATKHGFKYSDLVVPREWLEE